MCSFLKTNDYCATPQQLKDQVSEKYPRARRAYLKSGGDFPFLSRPDEVNLHLQEHLAWEMKNGFVIFHRAKESAPCTNIPSLQLINQTLSYGRELEWIV